MFTGEFWAIVYPFFVTALIVYFVIVISYFIIRRFRLSSTRKYSIIVASTLFVLYIVCNLSVIIFLSSFILLNGVQSLFFLGLFYIG
ncbi:hypothetical protein [Halalkalibacter urbisdiaboli]|uniref:hypothetical protein n=1 Tax=Halalkalibacter urbisdiaboli TaxID=1960589 RepID=UPI000B44F666|nr:hypothetical protein [Halalkalibacter urbisdiaboli]